MERPPLGLIPENLHREARVFEILKAIERYTIAGVEVPAEWFDELKRISKTA